MRIREPRHKIWALKVGKLNGKPDTECSPGIGRQPHSSTHDLNPILSGRSLLFTSTGYLSRELSWGLTVLINGAWNSARKSPGHWHLLWPEKVKSQDSVNQRKCCWNSFTITGNTSRNNAATGSEITFLAKVTYRSRVSDVSDGVDAPSERRHNAPEKTPDELRVKTRRRASMEQATIIGIDISKKSFQLHGATAGGEPVF